MRLQDWYPFQKCRVRCEIGFSSPTRHFWKGYLVFLLAAANLFASEVIEETHTQVIVREHPKTGRPYVCIVSSEVPAPPGPFEGQKSYSVPDYRLLDPKVKARDIPYHGPFSDRTKIYVLAASLATVGTVGGTAIIAAAPAATGAAASGGAGAYLAGGAAVAAGSAAEYAVATHSDPKKENYVQRSESELVKENGSGI